MIKKLTKYIKFPLAKKIKIYILTIIKYNKRRVFYEHL